jgi:SAM-dependent methyltransferase
MDPKTFAHEDRKYSTLWSDGYSEANWQRLARIVQKVSDNYSLRPCIIDFGCGSGAALDHFRSKGYTTAGTDISSYVVEQLRSRNYNVHHTSIDSMPMIEDNAYTFGFCNDCIEHVPEQYIQKSLDEMVRICSDYLFISVCPTPAHNTSMDGENLHLTVRPASWWQQLFAQYGTVEPMRFWFSRSLRYVIDLRSSGYLKNR